MKAFGINVMPIQVQIVYILSMLFYQNLPIEPRYFDSYGSEKMDQPTPQKGWLSHVKG